MEESLGYKLHCARESAGLTVDDVVYRAKIPRAVIEALEMDNFGFFSSPLYARSFLKQYGDYVGLDVSPWIDDLVPTAMIDGDSADAIIEIGKPMPPILRERQKKSGAGSSMAAVWLFVLTGVLVWGGMQLFKGFESKHAPPPMPEQQTSATEMQEERSTAAATGAEIPKRAIIVRDE
jgi:cytoskeleton protein RodZ